MADTHSLILDLRFMSYLVDLADKSLTLGGMMRSAADRIEALEAECFTLAAGACEHRSGDDHGNPFCLKTNQPI